MAEFKIRAFGEQFNTHRTRYRDVPVGDATFETGAVVFLDDGDLTEGGTNPPVILGVATAASDSYDWQEDTHGFVVPRVPIALADEEFRGTLLGTFDTDDIGKQYGITKHNDNGRDVWVVDRSKTGADARVTILGVDKVAITDEGVITEVADGDENVPVSFMFIPEYRQVN